MAQIHALVVLMTFLEISERAPFSPSFPTLPTTLTPFLITAYVLLGKPASCFRKQGNRCNWEMCHKSLVGEGGIKVNSCGYVMLLFYLQHLCPAFCPYKGHQGS
uniref:Uncharacterized protein n=1 Tax=Sphaerodactylus townsendi TaxID=933632 RepID=A0ACB8EI47_9SAUR